MFALRWIKSLVAPKIRPLNRAVVSRSAFVGNYELLRNLRKDSAMFPVVKSNAYGHGIEGAVRALSRTDCAMVAVDSYAECQFVMAHSKKDALVLGETAPENYREFDFERTAFCVWNPATVRHLVSMGRPCRVHLFFNTGMNREGVDESGLDALLAELANQRSVTVEGTCSHLSSADEADPSATEAQIAVFKRLHARVEAAGHAPKFRHIGASAGLLKIRDPFFNAFRPGIALYGFNPLSKEDPAFQNGVGLRPAMRVTSTVTAIRKVAPGGRVGYNGTFAAERESAVATLPFGYFEGLDRRLSNRGTLTKNGSRLPIAGRVSMNYSMVDATGADIAVGDEITVFSNDPRDPNSIESVAKEIGTIPYEVLVGLSGGMRREWE